MENLRSIKLSDGRIHSFCINPDAKVDELFAVQIKREGGGNASDGIMTVLEIWLDNNGHEKFKHLYLRLPEFEDYFRTKLNNLETAYYEGTVPEFDSVESFSCRCGIKIFI